MPSGSGGASESFNRDSAREAYRVEVQDASWHAVQLDRTVGTPYSNDAQAVFTDLYQLTMAYAYWKADKHNHEAVFDAYFRKCPFNGEFVVFAGVNELVRFVNTFHFTPAQLQYIQQVLPHAEPEFFDYLEAVSGSQVFIFAVAEGSLVFPNVPVVRVEGPLAVCQLLETAILNLVNFPSLVATNAAHHRLVVGWEKKLYEFGARRAQGPDGAMSASRYSYLGGVDATSNLRAGMLFEIPVVGTQAHSFVTSFGGLSDLKCQKLTFPSRDVCCEDFVRLVLEKRVQLCALVEHIDGEQQESELAAFISYAQSFPHAFLCLIDTYETLLCGLVNFLAVALALDSLGIRPIGVRMDSGDLAYLSLEIRRIFVKVSQTFGCKFDDLTIVASNNLNAGVIRALNEQGNSIDSFAVGTNLVTCEAQPALGMVYKLSCVGGRPTMKLSQDISKWTLPAKKEVYRLFSKNGEPMADLIQGFNEKAPVPGEKLFICHPLDPNKRCYVLPHTVDRLLKLIWDGGRQTQPEAAVPAALPPAADSAATAQQPPPGRLTRLSSLQESRDRCLHSLKVFRKDILRPLNPTPFKVSTSKAFSEFLREMWERTAPIKTLQ